VKDSFACVNDVRVVFWRRLLLGALLSGLACTEFKDANDTGGETVDGLLSPSGNNWTCLGGAATPPRTPPTNSAGASPATYILPVIDFVTQMTPSGVVARACARVDVDCDNPIVEDVTVSAAGVLALPLFEGFDGFVEVTAAGFVPALFFLQGPMQGDTQAFPAYLVPLSSAAALAVSIGAPLDERFGLIGFWALDCDGLPAQGVVMSNDAGGQIYNFVDGLPAFQQATVDGIGGFINVPPGRALVRAVLSGVGETIDVQSLVVRGGWISVSNLQPAP
jgi:hypothetical protein